MVDRALLMIADIGGYTQYMRLHRMSLAHSQEITGRLLEAMVRAVPRLDLVEIEGDAAFLYALVDSAASSQVADAADLASKMHQGFHGEQDRMIRLNMCSCPGCVEAGRLRVKFVAHVGDVARQTIKRRTQLVGLDVIAVHRMLKNSVPIDEYLLMTEPVYRQSPQPIRESATEIEDDLEGLGPTKLYYLPLQPTTTEPPPPSKPTLMRRVRTTTSVVCRSVPRMLRKQEEHAGAKSADPA
jgi:Protein of unknown function (DUF2652)